MKYRYLLCIGLFVFQHASAQIVLNGSSYYPSSIIGHTDTLSDILLSTVPPQTKGANQLWDMSGVTYTTDSTVSYLTVPTGSSFAANYVIATSNLIGQYTVPCKSAMGIDGSIGLIQYGDIINGQTTSMSFMTGNVNDTLYIPAQDAVFSKPLRNIVFPGTYLSNWSDTVNQVIHGMVTIPNLGWHMSPVEFHSTYYVHDTVSGWGKMKLKNSAGITVFMNVLQVKSSIMRIDSAFINGTLITVLEKDYSQLPRAWYTQYYGYKYYAMDNVTPLADIQHDFFYTIIMHATMQRKGTPDAVGQLTNDMNEPIAYPNPAYGGVFYIKPCSNAGKWVYNLSDVSGKIVLSGNIPMNTGLYKVEPSQPLAPGIYYLQLSNDSGKINIQEVQVK